MRTITAMFDSRSDAEDAMERLVSAGLSRSDISIVQQDAGASSTSTTTTSSAGGSGGGFLDSLANLFLPDDDRETYSEGVRRGAVVLSARVDDDLVDEAVDVLERSSAVDVDSRAQEWRSSGWQGYGSEGTSAITAAAAGTAAGGYGAGLREDTSRTTTTTTTTAGYDAGTTSTGAAATSGLAATGATARTGSVREGEEETLQVTEEQLRIGKREVGRGSVRVRSYVTERPVEEQVRLREERVTIERRPVDRDIAAGDVAAFQERTIELDERSEEAVVDKRARVVEEVVVGKQAEERVETVRDTVRRTDVEVDDERHSGRGATGTTFVETDRVSSTDVDTTTGTGTGTGRTRTPGV